MLPIVLHHGLFGHGHLQWGPISIDYFRGIDRLIAGAGHTVIVPGVHPTSSIEHRARQFKVAVHKRLKQLGVPRKKVIVMAHSMGGLDARYAISKLGMADQVAALVTVSTPHRGSPFADWVMQNLGRRLGGEKLVKWLRLDLKAALDLTTSRCEEFNRQVPDADGVRYFSISASRPWNKMPAFALHSHRVVSAMHGDNDGMVSVQSAIWGEHLETWAADHWHVINHRFTLERHPPMTDIAPHWLGALQKVKAAIGLP